MRKQLRRSHRARRIPHALRSWSRVRKILSRRKKLLLLSDYDGTLTPIVPRPEDALLHADMRAILRRLSQAPSVQVGIVSGRSLAVLRRFVRLPRLIYIGNHGFEIKGPGMRFVHPRIERSRRAFRQIKRQMRRVLSDIPGSSLEDKGLSLSVHWRRVAPGRVSRFLEVVEGVLHAWQARGRIRVTYGKCVVEVRAPIDWDKGRSVEWLVRRLGNRHSTGLVYLGDDRTDEDAFRSINRMGGVSVFVGMRSRKSEAHWYLKNPAEVHTWLQRLLSIPAAREVRPKA